MNGTLRRANHSSYNVTSAREQNCQCMFVLLSSLNNISCAQMNHFKLWLASKRHLFCFQKYDFETGSSCSIDSRSALFTQVLAFENVVWGWGNTGRPALWEQCFRQLTRTHAHNVYSNPLVEENTLFTLMRSWFEQYHLTSTRHSAKRSVSQAGKTDETLKHTKVAWSCENYEHSKMHILQTL